jgi:sulfate adenylyltransferase subunit 2
MNFRKMNCKKRFFNYNHNFKVQMKNIDKSKFLFSRDDNNSLIVWDYDLALKTLDSPTPSDKTLQRSLHKENICAENVIIQNIKDENNIICNNILLNYFIEVHKKKRYTIFFVQFHRIDNNLWSIHFNNQRGEKHWIVGEGMKVTEHFLIESLEAFKNKINKKIFLIPSGLIVRDLKVIKHSTILNNKIVNIPFYIFDENIENSKSYFEVKNKKINSSKLNHLDKLEAESIYIFREVVSQAINPVMLYSIGKDSAVLLHLAKKAFYPQSIPFPLLHVDTKWKFKLMYKFREFISENDKVNLIVFSNQNGIEKNINPFDHGSQIHTDIMKTEALKMALNNYKFDVAFGGARRDEEKSRAKERICSFRNESHRWDPKNQRPEIWNIFNNFKKENESIRAFPISNWTEKDVWEYIHRESIPIVPLYFAAQRPVINRNNQLLLVDDYRIKLFPNEKIELKKVRFRTLGCYPLTGAIESNADNLEKIINELSHSKNSERQGRTIDKDTNSSMEKKKKDGYF